MYYGPMWQWNPYFTKWENGFGVILHINISRTIFYYFIMTKTINQSNWKYKWAYLNQSSLCNFSKGLWYNDINTPKYESKYIGLILRFMLFKHFYYFMMTSRWKKHWIGVIGNTKQHISNNILPYKYIKGSMVNNIHILPNQRKVLGKLFILM